MLPTLCVPLSLIILTRLAESGHTWGQANGLPPCMRGYRRRFAASMVDVSAASHDCVNPMDLAIDETSGEDPIRQKAVSVLAMLEILIGGSGPAHVSRPVGHGGLSGSCRWFVGWWIGRGRCR